MSMIRVENITFSYPSSFDPVFENVSFQIDTEWKLGLVGRNGRGKTTLLKLLLGEYEYRGKITGAVTFDYFPFPVSDKTQMTEDILRQVCPNARQWELIRELSYLGIESEVLWRPFETMSNGEQTKALLAALFLKEEHFLLIDEPTNHLDVEGRRQMADYLKRKRGFILVSHDRYLLDEQYALKAVEYVKALNRKLNIPTIKEIKGITEERFEAIAERSANNVLSNDNARKITKEDYLELLKKAYNE